MGLELYFLMSKISPECNVAKTRFLNICLGCFFLHLLIFHPDLWRANELLQCGGYLGPHELTSKVTNWLPPGPKGSKRCCSFGSHHNSKHCRCFIDLPGAVYNAYICWCLQTVTAKTCLLSVVNPPHLKTTFVGRGTPLSLGGRHVSRNQHSDLW